jgi:hypothetical protein
MITGGYHGDKHVMLTEIITEIIPRGSDTATWTFFFFRPYITCSDIFSLDNIVRIWDTILVSPPSLPFFIAIAIMQVGGRRKEGGRRTGTEEGEGGRGRRKKEEEGGGRRRKREGRRRGG